MATAYRSSLDKINGSAIVKSLTITQQPTKTVYMEGEPLDLTGFRVSAVVEPFSGEVTSYVTTTLSNGQTIPAGISEISVRYGNAVASVPITVYNIEEIVVTTQPTTEYFVGDTLDLTGIVVTGYANNGTMSTDITELCTFSPSDGGMLATSGTQTVTVSYRDLTTTISVGVYQADTLTVTTMPTKTRYQLNETFDLTGIVVTASVSGTSLSQEVTSQCTFSPANGTVLNEEKTYTVTVTYNGISTSFDVRCSSLAPWDNRGLDYNSWDTIQQYIQAGELARVANVGETKSFVVNNKTYNAEIVSINDGTGDAGQWYPDKTVDFITKELYDNAYRYNSTQTNAGGFPNSALRGTLENTIYPLLPSDLKDVIVNKVHAYVSNSDGTTTIDSTKLWLPTQYEMSGSSIDNALGETSLNNKKYNLAFVYKSQTKYGSYYRWWLASPSTNETKCFWIVTQEGYIYNYGDTNTNGATKEYYVPICFRI